MTNYFMGITQKTTLPLAVVAIVAVLGACAPYHEVYVPEPILPVEPTEQETILDVKKKEEAAALKKAEATRLANKEAAEKKAASVAAWKKEQAKKASSYVEPKPTYVAPTPPAPAKKFYPTAASVPGRPGFVHNPYTHALVNVKGIASGKLVRDPADADLTHKFRVP